MKLIKLITGFIFILGLNVLELKAQQQKDTIFYNNDWTVISNREGAEFYRITIEEANQFKVLDYYINGKIQMEGFLSSIENNIKEGYFKYYENSGCVSSEGSFKNNKEEGLWKYYTSCAIWKSETYSNGDLNGEMKYFYKNGNEKRVELYESGDLISGKCFTKTGADTTYFKYTELPEFKGGEEKMYEYFSKKVVYPKEARKKNIEGKVVIRFWVNRDGIIENPEILSKTDPLLNESALKVLKNMPKWIPGKMDGIPVKVSFVLPFEFKLD